MRTQDATFDKSCSIEPRLVQSAVNLSRISHAPADYKPLRSLSNNNDDLELSEYPIYYQQPESV